MSIITAFAIATVIILGAAYLIRSKALATKKASMEQWKNKILAKYEPDVAEMIINKTVAIGFTKEMLFDSWGEPGDSQQKITKDKNRVKYFFGAYTNQRGNVKYSRYAVVVNGLVTEAGEIKR